MKKFALSCMAALAAASLIAMSCGSAAAAPKAKKPAKKPAAEQGGAGVISGKVAETMNSGGYTYVLLEKKGQKLWVAVPEMKGVKKGQTVYFQNGALMQNFESKTLKKTFPVIVFSPGPASPKAASAGASGGAVVNPGSKGAVPKAANVKVQKAAGEDAYTVAEVHEKAASLAGKDIAVRGKVVKVSYGIMKMNWLHIQDGSGSPEKGTNDLVVTTTSEAVNMGDVVTAKGKLTKDRDFGAGYRYEVIMENANVTK